MKKEKGAIVVEATVSLTAFIFAIFTILSLVNVCFIQAKIGVALNTAAKEISQYSYLYYALGVNNLESEFHKGTGNSEQLAKNTIDGIGVFMDSFDQAKEGMETYDFDAMKEAADNSLETVDSLSTQYGDAIGDDPKAFILGMAKMAADQGAQEIKTAFAQAIAKSFMKKNLVSGPGDNADSYLRRHSVVDGLSGLDFNYTTLMAFGQNADIQLVVTYDLRVLRLLNLDLTFKIRQCSKTTAWGNGISILKPEQNETGSKDSADKPGTQKENHWDNPRADLRGKLLIEEERTRYDMTSTGKGFDAYNNKNGANEFVTIITKDTHLPSYDTSDEIRGELVKAHGKILNSVDRLGPNVSLTKDGQTITVNSPPETRTLTIVMVIPDDADMATVKEGVEAFKRDYPDAKVIIRQGYGSPTREENTES